MSYEMNKALYDSVVSLNAEERFAHFISKLGEYQELWSLKDQNGWVTVGVGEEECIPVWPHPTYGLEWASDEWSDCYPDAISLDSWMTNWLPGMGKDGVKIVVFPNKDGEGLMVTSERLLEAVSGELEKHKQPESE